MRSKRTLLIAVLFAIAVLVAVIFSTPRRGKFRCNVCITYQGRQACRAASADTREQAIRAAIENTCAQIASGVTDSMQCEHTTPDRIEIATGKSVTR